LVHLQSGIDTQEPTPPSFPPHVVVKGLSKHYPGQAKASVSDLHFELRQGDMLALLGPSGCGKTTTLRMIAGLIEPSNGSIWIGGQDITHWPVHHRNIGMVFQSYALFPHMSVAQNVAFGLEMQGVARAERRQRVARALDLVRLGDKADSRIRQLSGGQQQRIALARALVTEPKVLLLDEPLSNLDAKLRDVLRGEIRAIQQRTGITAIFVTHDQDEALSMADRIAVMQDGRLVQIGSPDDIYQRPVNRFVADFIGRANFIEAVVESSDQDATIVRVPGLKAADNASLWKLHPSPHRPGAQVTLMIRPHHLHLQPAPAGDANYIGIDAEAREVLYRGDLLTYHVDAGVHRLTLEAHADARPSILSGQPLQLSCRRDAIALL